MSKKRACVHSKKSGIIRDMKKEYQATNVENATT